jgi:hypothetical protein
VPEAPKGCGRVTGTTVDEGAPDEPSAPAEQTNEETNMTVRVGQKAPNFEAPAYHQGSFTSIKLSEHLGKWILLCFYPGDFTFV